LEFLLRCSLLFGVFGRLGDGKTLALTYLTFEHWFKRRERICSNYHLFKIPYYYIHGINQLNFPKGTKENPWWMAVDELWRIIKARTPMLKQNDIVYDILGRSRKRSVQWAFSSQLKNSMDKLVVDVLDFISKPTLTPDNALCRLDIFAGAKASAASLVNSVRFWTYPFMKCYDDEEEVDLEPVVEGDPRLIFQPNFNREHGYCCECEECGTKFFKDWAACDLWATQWWETHWKEVFDESLLQKSLEGEG